ncbi:MAG: hypothetical protein ACRDHG_00955 [Anaerolineales bacterium]
MERQLTDDDILTFLRVNKRKYPSQIDLLQAAAQLLWPHGPPTDAGMRLARLALQEANHSRPWPEPASSGARRQTGPLGTGPLPQTSPLG